MMSRRRILRDAPHAREFLEPELAGFYDKLRMPVASECSP